MDRHMATRECNGERYVDILLKMSSVRFSVNLGLVFAAEKRLQEPSAKYCIHILP
jgi:hypothetical protein